MDVEKSIMKVERNMKDICLATVRRFFLMRGRLAGKIGIKIIPALNRQ